MLVKSKSKSRNEFKQLFPAKIWISKYLLLIVLAQNRLLDKPWEFMNPFELNLDATILVVSVKQNLNLKTQMLAEKSWFHFSIPDQKKIDFTMRLRIKFISWGAWWWNCSVWVCLQIKNESISSTTLLVYKSYYNDKCLRFIFLSAGGASCFFIWPFWPGEINKEGRRCIIHKSTQ